MDGRLSRRQFIQLAATGVVGAAAAQLVACAPQATPAGPIKVGLLITFSGPAGLFGPPTENCAKLGVAVLMTLALVGCGSAVAPTLVPGTPAPREGGTLVIGMESEVDILDPQASSGWVTHRVIFQMYESLVAEDLTRADLPYPPLVPGLAESWSISPDGLVYTFHLREGVRFHDGTRFNAQAVKYNIDRMFNKEAPQYYPGAADTTYFLWKDLDRVEVLDPLTVRLVFRRPFAEFLRMLAQFAEGSAGMISPTALKKWGNEGIAEHPVGTGPTAPAWV